MSESNQAISLKTSPYQLISSAQTTTHHALVSLVTRYAQTTYQRPIPLHQQKAFDQIYRNVSRSNKPIIIDSGCGTGLSTQKLAAQFSDHFVIGIDKSASRLARAPLCPLTNYLLVRANLIDMWRLLAEAQLPIVRHYLLYPNPWPKISHLKRRFYAHPIFKTLVSLSPFFELRTNWFIYAQECALALETLGLHPQLAKKVDHDYLTLFEKKYLRTNCPIYIVTL